VPDFIECALDVYEDGCEEFVRVVSLDAGLKETKDLIFGLATRAEAALVYGDDSWSFRDSVFDTFFHDSFSDF
jgi:hypothetical protein